jgi:uncharacterized protein YndB with AHSA1/START domain
VVPVDSLRRPVQRLVVDLIVGKVESHRQVGDGQLVARERLLEIGGDIMTQLLSVDQAVESHIDDLRHGSTATQRHSPLHFDTVESNCRLITHHTDDTTIKPYNGPSNWGIRPGWSTDGPGRKVFSGCFKVPAGETDREGVPEMIKAERSIVINRPVDEVFAYVGDQTNTPQWQVGLAEVRPMTDGPPGVGTRYAFVRKFMGRRMEATNEYVAYEPGRRIAFKTTSGPVALEASYLFESAAGGTKLTSRIEMQPAGLLRLVEPLMARNLRQGMKVSFVQLKDLLESRPASHPAAQ